MTQHSIIEHRANYFYVRLEDDYLALCERVNQEIEELELPERSTSGPADCKAMMLSILEHWMNSKKLTAKCEEDLYVYLTYDEWAHQLRYRYKRSVIIRCLKEMPLEGQWLDEQGEIHVGLMKSKHHIQNTYAYMLNVQVVQGLLSQLPEQSPYGPRPKILLGRPKKSRSEINDIKENGLKINGLKTDDIPEIPSENTPINAEIPSKNKRSFYTQITNTQITNTQIGVEQRESKARDAPRTPQKSVSLSPQKKPETPPRSGENKKIDLMASASPGAQAVITEWLDIFQGSRPITKTLIEHAEAIAAYKPLPGEVAKCRLWQYATDRKLWYAQHGHDLGDVAREFGKFRSLQTIPAADDVFAFPSGAGGNRGISSFDNPDYDMSNETYGDTVLLSRSKGGDACSSRVILSAAMRGM